jgi:dolichol-phosphate mannosyltransferase
MLRPPPLLDVVVPCYNEEEVLESTWRSISEVAHDLSVRGEIADWRLILVDNASTDRTLEIMRKLFEGDAHVMIVALRRNFGFQGSLSAGLAASKGDAVVSIDADLQDPPELIGQMVRHYREGYDLVLGVRSNRKEADGLLVRVLAHAYYTLARWFMTPTVPQHGDFRLVARSLADVINALPERNRFLRTMIPQLESRYATVEYSRRKRTKGRSKSNVLTVLSIALDGIVGFGFQPLRIGLALGAAVALVGAVFTALVFIKYAQTGVFPWDAALLTAILIVGAIQFVFLGVIGEFVGRIFIESRGRPPYLVRERLEHPASESGA